MRRIPTITKNLLIINVLAFLMMYALRTVSFSGAGPVDLNDIFGLGIKKEINDGLFISLIIDGYFALQEKDEN